MRGIVSPHTSLEIPNEQNSKADLEFAMHIPIRWYDVVREQAMTDFREPRPIFDRCRGFFAALQRARQNELRISMAA